MFNWFWDFLYMISKTLFRMIDGLILCANKLCGIDPIGFDGDKDFLSYLLFSSEISFAFRVSALIATILLIFFTIFMIIRSITKEKAEGTPAQIAVKAFKSLLMFFFIPICIFLFMQLGNTLVSALYEATRQGTSSPGAFLFSAFAIDGGMDPEIAELFRTGELDYNSTELVNQYMNISDFPFFLSWIAGGVVLFGIGYAMLTFVDRVLSLVILYIAAPLSISSSVLDDGARFKLWRDQFLTKFIMGYGMILTLNIYALICGLVTASEFAFFPDDRFLDLIMKLLIIAGGALTLQKSMALVGNLIASGAGSSEFRDNAFSMGTFAMGAYGVAKGALSLPFKLLPSRNKNKVQKSSDKSSAQTNDKSTSSAGNSNGDFKISNWDADNNEKPKYGNNEHSTKKAILGNQNNDGNSNNNGNGGSKNDDNTNTNKTNQNSNNNNNLNNIINGGGITEKKNEKPEEEQK